VLLIHKMIVIVGASAAWLLFYFEFKLTALVLLSLCIAELFRCLQQQSAVVAAQVIDKKKRGRNRAVCAAF